MAKTDIYTDDPDNGCPNFGRPALRALHAAGYTRSSELADVSDELLLTLHGVGPKAVRIIRAALAQRDGDAAE